MTSRGLNLRSSRVPLACLYQVVNDAGLVFEHLYDLGV